MSSFEFNPFTGTFDLVGTGGGSGPGVNELDLNKIANENISALQLVTPTSETNVEVADLSTYETSHVLGVALIAALALSPVTIKTFGELSDPSFTFTNGESLYLSPTGTVTNTPPTSGHLTKIGYALGANKIFIQIEQPIIL